MSNLKYLWISFLCPISASIAILLVVYSALGELKLRNQLESTDKEFQIKRDCKGNIISHAKIDCGTY